MSVKDDPLLLLLATDHIIQDVDAFTQGVDNGVPLAEAGCLVILGMVASSPIRVLDMLNVVKNRTRDSVLMRLLRNHQAK